MNQTARRTVPVGTWQASGLCRDRKDDLFFPDGETRPAALAQISAAKAIWVVCPVMSDCQDWALENGETDGVWGGLSEADRRSIHRRAARAGTPLRETAAAPPVRHATPAAALTARSVLKGGHRLWTGSSHFTIDGERYVARRVAFEELHGRPPVGVVRTSCEHAECIAHLTDRNIRAHLIAVAA